MRSNFILRHFNACHFVHSCVCESVFTCNEHEGRRGTLFCWMCVENNWSHYWAVGFHHQYSPNVIRCRYCNYNIYFFRFHSPLIVICNAIDYTRSIFFLLIFFYSVSNLLYIDIVIVIIIYRLFPVPMPVVANARSISTQIGIIIIHFVMANVRDGGAYIPAHSTFP